MVSTVDNSVLLFTVTHVHRCPIYNCKVFMKYTAYILLSEQQTYLSKGAISEQLQSKKKFEKIYFLKMKREKWEGPWWRKYVLYIIASAMQPPSLSRPIANVSPSLNGDPSSNALSWITMENNGEKDIFWIVERYLIYTELSQSYVMIWNCAEEK